MATITISFEVNDDQQIHLLNNFNEMVERRLKVSVNGYPLAFDIEEKSEEENNRQFGKRAIKSIVLNMVKANALYTDRIRQQTEIAAIDEITENISDDLLI